MSEKFLENGFGLSINDSLVCHMERYIGRTVTIFTTSGGMSGCGFTGVLLGVNDCFVKLLSQIGPAPGCAIGNSCSGTPYSNGAGCNGNVCNGMPIGSVGAVTDIPICSIAGFVHDAI